MNVVRLYAILLLLAVISGLIVPIAVMSEQKTVLLEPVKSRDNINKKYPYKVLVAAYSPTKASDVKPLKVDLTKVEAKVVAHADTNNDHIEDLLVKRLTTGFYKASDTLTALVMFKVNPPTSDVEANIRLKLALQDIARRLVTQYPQVKVLNTYTYALVGMKIQLPANLTLLREVARYLSTVDLNGDGVGDLWLIEDLNKQKRLYNYYSGKALYIRPWIYQDFGINGSGVTASVSDTGIDDSHVAFKGKLLMYWSQNTGANLTAAYDPHGHGTHVSGTIAGYYASTDAQGRIEVSWGFTYDYSSSGWYSLYDAPMYVDAPGTINVTVYQTGRDVMTRICLFFTGNISRFYAAVNGLAQNLTCINIVQNTWNTLTYNVTNSSQYGFYYIRYYIQAGTGLSQSSEYWILAWPVNSTAPNGIPYFSGIAYGAKLVVANIFYNSTTDPTVDALNWIISVRTTYNITTHNMSWGYTNGTAAGVEAAVTSMANSGIIPVVAAGNDGVYNNTAATTSPAENCFAITVAALDQWTLNVTSYSSGGGNATDYPGTVKPDLASIGGWVNGMVLSADTNDAEDYTPTGSEVIPNDTQPMMGTSMATPHVTGIMTLASAAYRQYLNKYVGRDWDWNTSRDVLFLKNLALISTFETYPLTVLDLSSTTANETAYSPTLDKGGKDTTEGYGALDPYALIYAIMTMNNPLEPGAVVEGKFRAGTIYKGAPVYPNIFDYGPSVYVRLFILPNRTITLPNGTSFNVTYKFQLILNTTNVTATDYDLYLYNYTGEYTNTTTRIVCGEPIILAKSVNGFGANESITYTPPKDNWPVWVVVKRARMDSAGGNWVLVTSPSVDEYGRPYGGADFNASDEAWIGWPIKINGSMTKDIARVVVEIFAQNGTRLARLDSANGDITIIDPAYYSTYNTTWTVPFDNSLVGTYLTVVTYFYDSTGTLVQGPVTTQVYVNAAPAPIPEPSILPVLMVLVLVVIVAVVVYGNKFKVLFRFK